MTAVKICGINTPDDALAAIDAGADYLGLIFVPDTPRYVTLDRAEAIMTAVCQAVPVVGVFQNADETTICDTQHRLGLDFIQLHGNESPAFCLEMPAPVIKALVCDQTFNAEFVGGYCGDKKASPAQYLLLDKPKTGSDSKALFETAATLKREPSCPPYFIAGRLTADTVGHIISQFNPYGVDVASGVEQAPGVKDAAKMQAFCEAVRLYAGKEAH